MQIKKEKLMSKIVKRNFNNELEAILEKKDFEENVKSSLLGILYKIEVAYQDIATVKQDINTKEEYIEKLISIIQHKCASIKLVRMNSENVNIPENGTFFVDKKNGSIESYPIERKVLYAIWKIGKKDKIIKKEYFLINTVLSDLLIAGNNIDKVEPIRDFNGYSWTTISSEIESIYHNLIYQNLRILVGNEFLDEWVYHQGTSTDYYAMFLEKLSKQYGKEKSNKIKDLLTKISTLLEMKFEPQKLSTYKKDKKRVTKELIDMQDKQLYVETLTKQKSMIATHIKEIDTILNDKKLLQIEYVKRNQDLPLNNKIFSMKILSEIMVKERERDCRKIEELNDILNPKHFVEHKKELEDKYKYLSILDCTDVEKALLKYTMQFEKVFLACLTSKIKKAKTKQEISSLIYQFRYYLQLPITHEKCIIQVLPEKDLEILVYKLLEKAEELKAIQTISKNKILVYEIWKNIFKCRVIRLEDLTIKITKEKNQYFLHIFDGDTFEVKTELKIFNEDGNQSTIDIKLNKKIKIFE